MTTPTPPWDHTRRIAEEYESQLRRMGPPPLRPRPLSDARAIYEMVRLGDGKHAEAVAAVMWHCRLSVEEAQLAVQDGPR